MNYRSLVRQRRPDLSQSEANALALRLNDRILSATKELERKNPPPQGDYLAKVAHLNGLAAQARELVLTEELGGPDEPQEPYEGPAEMLTPSELESLRREARENDAYFKQAFAHLRPKAANSEQKDGLRRR